MPISQSRHYFNIVWPDENSKFDSHVLRINIQHSWCNRPLYTSPVLLWRKGKNISASVLSHSYHSCFNTDLFLIMEFTCLNSISGFQLLSGCSWKSWALSTKTFIISSHLTFQFYLQSIYSDWMENALTHRYSVVMELSGDASCWPHAVPGTIF